MSSSDLAMIMYYWSSFGMNVEGKRVIAAPCFEFVPVFDTIRCTCSRRVLEYHGTNKRLYRHVQHTFILYYFKISYMRVGSIVVPC